MCELGEMTYLLTDTTVWYGKTAEGIDSSTI